MSPTDETVSVVVADLDESSAYRADAYMEWQPAEHGPDCKRPQWHVRTFKRPPIGDGLSTEGLRAYCTGCGLQYEMTARTGWRDGYGEVHGPTVTRDWAYRGHQTPPVKVSGLWMHADGEATHPRSTSRETTWGSYYITASSTPPASREEVIGLVAVELSPRGKTRWAAALMAPSHTGRYLEPVHKSLALFTSPRSAARWIANAREEAGDA